MKTPPERSEDMISEALCTLTKAISKKEPDSRVRGLLGGDYGYGCDYSNDVFAMKPYCWCESPDCGWCEGNKSNFYHKKSGVKIWWYKYIGRGMKINNKKDADIIKVIDECILSLKVAKKQHKD